MKQQDRNNEQASMPKFLLEDIAKEKFVTDKERFMRVNYNFINVTGCKTADPIELYNDVHMYKDWANRDQVSINPGMIESVKGNLECDPKIYATFHVGSYRTINHLLLCRNINYCLAVSNRVLEEQGNAYRSLHQQLIDEGKSSSRFEIIDAEDKASVIRMIRFVKQGYSLLLYMDGNSGIGGMSRSDDKLIIAKFFNTVIHVRKGIAYMSHLLKLPIVPILSNYDERGKIHYQILDKIEPADIADRDEFVAVTTQKLWSLFEDHLSHHWFQWEGWLYINEFISHHEVEEQAAETGEYLTFNSNRYDTYYQDKHYIFDKAKASSYPISESLFKLINYLNTGDRKVSSADLGGVLPDQLFKQLVTNKILI